MQYPPSCTRDVESPNGRTNTRESILFAVRVWMLNFLFRLSFVHVSDWQESCHEFEQLVIVQCEALIQLIQERREFLLETLQMDKDNKLRILKVRQTHSHSHSSIPVRIPSNFPLDWCAKFAGTTNKLHWKIATNHWPNTILHRSTERDWQCGIPSGKPSNDHLMYQTRSNFIDAKSIRLVRCWLIASLTQAWDGIRKWQMQRHALHQSSIWR